MWKVLNDILVDPIQRQPMKVSAEVNSGDNVVAGECLAEDGNVYPIVDGIPRLVVLADDDQLQTQDAFSFKWQRRDSYDSDEFKSFCTDWLVEKYGFKSLEEWVEYYNSRRCILDAGCGSAFSSALFLDTPYWTGDAMWVGLDISLGVDTAQERLAEVSNVHFVQANVLHPPFLKGTFDTVFSEGVLHHTPSTREALLSAAELLEPGGEFHFYVYRKKGPIREFTDDHIRQAIEPLSDEEAWESMRELTALGEALHNMKAEIDVPRDIPLLGIKAGKQDIQRFVYWSFAKLFWNSTCSFEENLHVNFDWYRPQYAHRQTEDEVRSWCDEAGLSITWFHEQESGYTVRARKE